MGRRTWQLHVSCAKTGASGLSLPRSAVQSTAERTPTVNTITSLDTVERAVAEIAHGRPVVVVDDEDRENEGDLTFAASLATPELMALLVRHTSGYVCAPAAAELLDRLELPLMVPDNQDSLRTAYTVSVDAATGVGTGISAADRARTVRVLADP